MSANRTKGAGGIAVASVPALEELWSDLDPDERGALTGKAMANDTARTEQGTLYRIDLEIIVEDPTPGETIRAAIYNDEDGDVGTELLARSAPVSTADLSEGPASFWFSPFVLPAAYHVAIQSVPAGETGTVGISDDAKEIRTSSAVPVVAWSTGTSGKKMMTAGWGVAP